jgi:uncharacterized protein (TIGR02680 family)
VSPLPAPTRSRWQPLRAGLVDLFYYDVEEFRFRDGRLLLRGNNGTGKSKVLALLLPFLLDGDLSPHRVEPDADQKKRMEWNLLLGGEHPHPERLGYTWLEFGRLTEDGTPAFRTLGCGLKAVAGRGIARHWFFVTEQRVGEELALVDATRTALSRERLGEALAGRGTVHDRARNYRRAVDEALFGLGEGRYGALVDLLVQLRQPQLSKRPSEKALSDALTEALPPLDQAVVADVAEAFRSLEADRHELAAMVEAHGCAQMFLTHYRRYATIAARRRAELPRRAEQRYRTAREELASTQEEHRRAEEAAAAALARLEAMAEEQEQLRARDRALRESPEMRSARDLDRAAEEARRRADEERVAGADRDAADRRVQEVRRRSDAAARRAVEADAALGSVRDDVVAAAAPARLAEPHLARVDEPLGAAVADPASHPAATPDGDAELVTALRRTAEGLAARQEQAVRHVERLLDADAEAARALAAARHEVELLAARAAELAERRADAAADVAARGAELVAAVRAHLETATEITVDAAAVLAALELWVETLDGPDPASAAVQAAGRSAAAALAGRDAELARQREAERERERTLAAEISRLEAGEHGAPPAPHTRDPEVRATAPGAPLWRLVDFAEHLDAERRAGLEAALEASGLLDGWLAPDGALRGADGDVLLRPSAGAPRPPTTLAALLRPAIDPGDAGAVAVGERRVAALLDAIGLGEHGETWVAPDGRFRVGVLTGAWRKPAAEYVGRGARETARRALLAQRRAELAEVHEELRRIAAASAVVAQRQARLDAQLAAVPHDGELRAAHVTVGLLAGQQVELQERQEEAAGVLADAGLRAEAARDALAEGAADVDLPADRPGLAEVREAVSAYRVALAALWPAMRARTNAHREAAEIAAELRAAEEMLSVLGERATEARRGARAAGEAYDTLRETVGAAVEELQRRLAEVGERLRAVEREQRAASAQRERAVAERGRAEGLREAATRALSVATEERAAAAAALRRFAGTGLLTVALPELAVPPPDDSWAPDPTVRLARQIDQQLEEVSSDDSAWDRAQRRVTDELKTLTDTLARHGNSASAQLLEDGIVVEVVFRGRPATVPELAEALGTEVVDRQRLLDEREREILENHLVNEVASTLQELIAEAERQVAAMNAELQERPTSTGMRLRLEWRAREDGPAGLAEARRRLLRQTSDAWSEDDRAAVGGFLQARIAEVRARDEAGTWLEHLTSALDYRGWHRFVIERHQNGGWRSATGPASGGERVLAASVPLFAAASAHYASAGNPHAPRLVMLDEAFAGVDDNARAKYLGLLAAFDLDVVMTSEREWGCYPEVPGLAIAQLARTDGVAAVLVTPWEWDGRQRRRLPRPLTLAAAAAPAAPPTEGLFDDL